MDRDELVFVLRSVAEDVEKGFKQAEQAVEDLGRSYEDLTDAEKRMHEANDDLRKRLDAMKKTMNSVNLESARMPRELRQVTTGFKAAASGAGAFAVAMIGIQLVAGLITKIAEAAKKAKEELAKLNQEAKKLAEQTSGMAFLVNRYEELAKQVTRSKEETAQMEGISRTLVDTYGMRADAVDDEGRLILTSLGYMKEQLEVSRELTILIGQRAEAENKKSTADALKLLNEGEERRLELIEKIAALEADLSADFAYSDWVEATGELEDLSQRIVDAYELVGERAQLAMQVARTQMGDEAAKIPAEVQARIMEEVLKSGEMPTAALFVEKFTKALKDGIKPAEGAGEAIKLTTEQIERMAAKAKAAKTDLKGMTSSVQGLDNSTASLKKEIQDLNDLQTAINVLKEGDQSSKDFGLALDYLAERYGVSADQVMDNLGAYQRDADIKATLLELNLLLAEQEAITAKQTAVAMAQAGDITVYQASRMIAALDDVILKLRELSGDESGTSGISLKTVGVSMPTSWRTGKSTKSTGGGSTKAQAYKNTALEKELALIERKRNLDQITTAEEIQLYEKALRTLAKTTEEKEQLQDKLYQLRKDKERQAYDDSVYFGRLTLEQQREQIKQMIQQYKVGTDARIALERELYDVQQEIRQRDTENLDRLAQGVVQALQNRYSVHREEELSALQASMKAWGDWAQVQVDAINAQIRALDDLTKQEDRGDEETRRRRKIAALEQQLLYETDEYNRRKLEEQLAREKDDLSKWQTRNEREDQKQALRDQATHVQDRARAVQDALRDQMDAVNKFYDDRLQAQALAAEASYVMMEGSQDDIVELIGSYAPEYDALGQTLGERMYEGFMAKAGGIPDFIASVDARLQATQDKAAQLATQSAIDFWAGQGAPVVGGSGGTSKSTSNAVTINLYGDNQSPAQLSREMERTLDRMSR